MFENFLREKRLLVGVSPATILWYEESLKHLPTETPTAADLKQYVMTFRDGGLKATGINCKIRAVNAYLHWRAGSETKCSAGCHHLKIPQLKEPQIILPTFSAPQVKLLISWKPKTFYERRLHLMILALFDTGSRISEILGLRFADCDLENLLIKLKGKGDKERRAHFVLTKKVDIPIRGRLRVATARTATQYPTRTQTRQTCHAP